MSDLRSTRAKEEFMLDLLHDDPEGWARLSGLIACLGLTTRRRIEIEIKPGSDKWMPIDGISVERSRIVCSWGVNGHRETYQFVRGEQTPQWRFVGGRMEAPAFIEAAP